MERLVREINREGIQYQPTQTILEIQELIKQAKSKIPDVTSASYLSTIDYGPGDCDDGNCSD